MKKLFYSLMISALTLTSVNADRSTVLETKSISIQVNANGQIECHPGTESPLFPTNTVLSIDIGSDPFGFAGTKRNVETVTHEAGIGDRCAQFAGLFGNPNPHWVHLKGTRTVTESYVTEFGSRCGHYLEEVLELKIGATATVLRGSQRFGIRFVDPAQCR